LSRKYKVTVVALVSLAVMAILLVSNVAMFAPGEEKSPGEEEFTATADPYRAYNEALDEGKPVVIEFYARW